MIYLLSSKAIPDLASEPRTSFVSGNRNVHKDKNILTGQRCNTEVTLLQQNLQPTGAVASVKTYINMVNQESQTKDTVRNGDFVKRRFDHVIVAE